MEKTKSLKLGSYTIAEWYRAVFAILGAVLVAVVVAELTYFLIAGLLKAVGQ